MMSDRRPRDKEATRRDVLEAAKQLFSQKGLHGTSFRDLEKASGVSKGLIIHHFHTKENLYAELQDSLNEHYTSWMAEQRDSGEGLREITEIGIRGSLGYMQSHPEFRRIMLWSYLEGQTRTTDLDKRFFSFLIRAMQSGQSEGLVRDDLKAAILPFIIRGTIDYWIRSETLRQALDPDLVGDLSDEDLVETLLRIVLL